MDISGVYCIVNRSRYASTDPQRTLFPWEGPYGLVRAITRQMLTASWGRA